MIQSCAKWLQYVTIFKEIAANNDEVNNGLKVNKWLTCMLTKKNEICSVIQKVHKCQQWLDRK